METAAKASRTALFTAYFRGYHSTHDHPKIFDDSLAFSLLTEDERREIEDSFRRGQATIDPVRAASFPDREAAIRSIMQRIASFPIVLGRARYAEDLLATAVAEGVRQYVILGAGMDSFAFRCPELAAKLRVYEIDHPAMQTFKRNRLRELGWDTPENLHFIPVDFATGNLSEALDTSSYERDMPTFFSWLGVTYYLSRESVFSNFSSISQVASKGSMIVFDYLDSDAFIPEKTSPRIHHMLAAVKEAGEPMLSGFDPLKLANELKQYGVHVREDMGPVEIQQRYFLGRTDDYRASEYVHYACAVVS